MNDLAAAFSASLCAARKRQGLTIRQVAGRAGLSVSGVSRAEVTGGATLDTAVRLCRALGLSLDAVTAPAAPLPPRPGAPRG